MNTPTRVTALFSLTALSLILLSGFSQSAKAQIPTSADPCMVDNATFLGVHSTLYQTFLMEQERIRRERRGQNARSDNVIDLLIGGMAQSVGLSAMEATFHRCPVTVDLIARGASPFSNSQTLTDLLTNALVLQDKDIRKTASDMTSPQFRRWLQGEYHRWLRGIY